MSQEVFGRFLDFIDVASGDLLPWSGLFQEQISYNHRVERSRQFPTPGPLHQVLYVREKFIPQDGSNTSRDFSCCVRFFNNLAGMSFFSDLIGKFLV